MIWKREKVDWLDIILVWINRKLFVSKVGLNSTIIDLIRVYVRHIRFCSSVAFVAWAGAWDISFSNGGGVVLDLGSWSGLRSSLSWFGGDVLSLSLVVVFLGDADWTGDVESSSGNLAVLLGFLSLGAAFWDLSLVGDGVLVWDDDVLGTDLGLGGSGLGWELGETGLVIELTWSEDGLSTWETAWGNSWAVKDWGFAWGSTLVALSVGVTNKGDNSESVFHIW